HWSPQEVFVWRKACSGDVADISQIDPVLHSRFLETILLKDKYRHALTRNGVRIVGAQFTEPVDIAAVELAHSLELTACVLEKGGNFPGAKSSHLIALDGCKVTGMLDLSGLRAEDLSMNGNAKFEVVNLGSAEISRQLRLDRATVAGQLDMDNIRVGHLF